MSRQDTGNAGTLMTSWQHYESLKTRIVVRVENPDPLNPDPLLQEGGGGGGDGADVAGDAAGVGDGEEPEGKAEGEEPHEGLAKPGSARGIHYPQRTDHGEAVEQRYDLEVAAVAHIFHHGIGVVADAVDGGGSVTFFPEPHISQGAGMAAEPFLRLDAKHDKHAAGAGHVHIIDYHFLQWHVARLGQTEGAAHPLTVKVGVEDGRIIHCLVGDEDAERKEYER